MKRALVLIFVLVLAACTSRVPPATGEMASDASVQPLAWPAGLPVYDHIVMVVEENKDYAQVIGNPDAPYINATLLREGANLLAMYGEEHHSQGNYFWLFSGSNQNVGYFDFVPRRPIAASNLGAQLIAAGRSFKGYAEDLPAIGSTVHRAGSYARKHVPWISFSNVPNGMTAADSANLRFADFPADFNDLPTVAIVVPNLDNDMHDGSVGEGDLWLRENLDDYYQWAKTHNSLLILTFDESDSGHFGLTDPADREPDERNRIVTILAGAHIKPGEYIEGAGVTHVNLLRTIEAMYGLPPSGRQQRHALAAGIADDFTLTDLFAR